MGVIDTLGYKRNLERQKFLREISDPNTRGGLLNLAFPQLGRATPSGAHAFVNINRRNALRTLGIGNFAFQGQGGAVPAMRRAKLQGLGQPVIDPEGRQFLGLATASGIAQARGLGGRREFPLSHIHQTIQEQPQILAASGVKSAGELSQLVRESLQQVGVQVPEIDTLGNFRVPQAAPLDVSGGNGQPQASQQPGQPQVAQKISEPALQARPPDKPTRTDKPAARQAAPTTRAAPQTTTSVKSTSPVSRFGGGSNVAGSLNPGLLSDVLRRRQFGFYAGRQPFR